MVYAALPIGEYAAVTLLMFFGLKAIKDAWDLPSSNAKNGEKNSNELDEYAEAEELVKEKVINDHSFDLYLTILVSFFKINIWYTCRHLNSSRILLKSFGSHSVLYFLR